MDDVRLRPTAGTSRGKFSVLITELSGVVVFEETQTTQCVLVVNHSWWLGHGLLSEATCAKARTMSYSANGWREGCGTLIVLHAALSCAACRARNNCWFVLELHCQIFL
jgi:hypothetical protein